MSQLRAEKLKKRYKARTVVKDVSLDDIGDLGADQITPTILPRMLKDPNPEKSKRVMEAMMTMVKLDVAELERAYNEA